jgi:hypothetical protein
MIRTIRYEVRIYEGSRFSVLQEYGPAFLREAVSLFNSMMPGSHPLTSDIKLYEVFENSAGKLERPLARVSFHKRTNQANKPF